MIPINRTAMMVKPGQSFLDGLHRADPTSHELNLEDLRREATIYLLPECENEEEAREYLEEMCGEIFEEQLNGGYRVPASWPSRRDLDALDRWFEWSLHSVVSISATLRCSKKRSDPRGPFFGPGLRPDFYGPYGVESRAAQADRGQPALCEWSGSTEQGSKNAGSRRA